MIGIEKYFLIEIVHSINFKSLSNCMIDVGKKIIFQNQKFYVKVILSEKSDQFLAGDLEFYVTGNLVEVLSSKNIKPAKKIENADKIISCFICKDKSYISYESSTGVSGFPKNYHKEKIVCGIYNENSILSAFQLIKLGFTPHLFFLYSDRENLLYILKLLKKFFEFLGESKISFDFYFIDNVFGPEYTMSIIMELLYVTILSNMYPSFKYTLPYSYVLYPEWFINNLLDLDANKNSINPILYHTRTELEKIKEELNMNNLYFQKTEDNNLDILNTQKKIRFKEHQEAINKIFFKINKAKKSISTKITPNYIHDIMDSI